MTTTRTRPTTQGRLGRRTRKGVLVAHISAAGAWIGIDVVLAVFVLTAMLTDDPQTQAVAYQALGIFAVWPLLTAGLMCLATGVLLGLGTGFGLVRYWWVALELAITVVLTTLVAFALRPGVYDVADAGRQLLGGQDASVAAGDLIYPPAVSLGALTVAVALSVFKPWGAIRRRSPRQRAAGRAT